MTCNSVNLLELPCLVVKLVTNVIICHKCNEGQATNIINSKQYSSRKISCRQNRICQHSRAVTLWRLHIVLFVAMQLSAISSAMKQLLFNNLITSFINCGPYLNSGQRLITIMTLVHCSKCYFYYICDQSLTTFVIPITVLRAIIPFVTSPDFAGTKKYSNSWKLRDVHYMQSVFYSRISFASS